MATLTIRNLPADVFSRLKARAASRGISIEEEARPLLDAAAGLVEALGLKEGDQIEIRVAGDRAIEVTRDRSRQKAIERLRRLRRPLPAGFTFDREEVHER